MAASLPAGASADLSVRGRGDEVLVVVAMPADVSRQNLQLATAAVLQFMLRLKFVWAFSAHNYQFRIGRGLLPHELAIGMHVGLVVPFSVPEAFHVKRNKNQDDYLGFEINCAKRVETVARDGTWTRLYVSKPVKELLGECCPDIIWTEAQAKELKGILGHTYVNEIQEVLHLSDWVGDEVLKQVAVDTVGWQGDAAELGLVYEEAITYRQLVAAALEILARQGDEALKKQCVELRRRLLLGCVEGVVGEGMLALCGKQFHTAQELLENAWEVHEHPEIAEALRRIYASRAMYESRGAGRMSEYASRMAERLTRWERCIRGSHFIDGGRDSSD